MIINTPDGLTALRLAAMRIGMEFELKTGMKLARGPSCITMAKREYGLKGNARKVYAAFCAMHGVEPKDFGGAK
jgi:hypothetical protein